MKKKHLEAIKINPNVLAKRTAVFNADLTCMSLQSPKLLILLLFAISTSCKDLQDFSTQEGTNVFRGQVIGTTPSEDEDQSASSYCEGDGTNQCSFIRKGFTQGTQMELSFDATTASFPQSNAGYITTDDDVCGAPTFNRTPLLPIIPLENDFLSQYTFPGKSRLRNYIFLAKPNSGRLEGREAMVFLSLVPNEKVEVRIVAGQGRGCADDHCEAFEEGQCDFFGIFPLKKASIED